MDYPKRLNKRAIAKRVITIWVMALVVGVIVGFCIGYCVVTKLKGG